MDKFIFAQNLAKQAGKIAHDYFKKYRSLSLTEKSHSQDLVSEADIAVEEFILEQITSAFPEDGFLGEEHGLVEKNNNYWVIDPIDGTSNFVRGIGYYCISIAFVQDNQVDFGVIFDPSLDELFYARRGGGAYVNGVSIHVEQVPFNRALIDLGRCKKGVEYPNYELLKLIFERGAVQRFFGSGALVLAHIGAGRLSAFYESYILPWDAFAGLIICEEAGAIVNDYMKSMWMDGGEIFVATPSIADEFKALIQKAEELPSDA